MGLILFPLFVFQVILYSCFLVFAQSQKGNTQSSSSTQTSTVSIDVAYIRLDNLYCLGFNGSICNQCYSTINYYLYGNRCVRFQDRDSDNSTTSPVKQLIRVCDSQCDSNSCQTTTFNKGLCTGCKYSSQSSTFYGYGFYNGNTSLFESCVTECNHFGQLFGEITTKGVGVCSNCPTACEFCSSKTLCIECSYRYQRYTGSSALNFSKQVLNTSNSSSQSVSCNSRNLRTSKSVLETQGNLSRDYYVTSKTRDSPCTIETCQGTIVDPFDDINLVFVHLLDKFLLGQKEEAVINIYLMKGKKTDVTLDHFWKEQNLTSAYKRVFERTAVDVSIQPLVCNGSNITEGCYTSDEKANVILKSNKISFFITKTFTFKNIILDASELIPHSICYEENKNSTNRCCIDNGGTYPTKSDILLSNGASNDAQCEPPKYSWGNSFLQVPWEAFSPTQDLWKKGPFAFFTMNFLRDYPKYIPTLVIEDCVFKNFWYHRYAYSFIYLDQRGSKLTINNTKFQNFYFPMGLVTNMQKLTQRNSFFTTNLISTAIANCSTFNSSLSNCHSLTLQNSVFEGGYFGNFTLTATDPDYYSNEGIVLSLQEFRGPILLQNNIFRNLASIKFSLVNNRGITEGISAICSNPRASFNDSYRLSLDRHMQVVIGHENWSKKPLTSSVLSLRNLTQGLTLYNNTFTNNAAETGSALFIHNFENTQDKPIIIESNNFNQNFAKEFGTAIAILKYERDYINLQCKGVYLSNNTFEDNFGCPYVKGTVIVSCIPEKPYVSDMSPFYDLGSSSLQAYILGYFVSVNGVNSYKIKTGSIGTKSRFTDLQVSETDDLTQKVFSKFVRDITATKELINGTIHPIFGTIIDTNRITSIQNTFIRNYAYHSHLFFQGAYNTLVKETTFQDNSAPVPQFLPESLSSSITLFKKALGSASYWKAVETTPLMVRMSNYIVIQDSLFINNTQMLTDSLSLPFGAAITIDKHLGLANVSMINNTFKSNWGWTSSTLYQKVKNTIEETIASKIEPALGQGIQGTLITYNYWDYMYGIKVYDPANVPKTASGFYDNKTAIPYVFMNSCTFMNNSFDLSSNSQIGLSTSWDEDYRTAIIRYYNAHEGISLNGTIANTNTNPYGTYVLYAKVVYTGCTFNLNVINDQRTFINPYGFNSLIIINTTFESNTINDQDNGYYSIRTYLYSFYKKDDSMASLIAKNLTFRNNVGKLMYFEDEKTVDQTRSTTKYQISLNDIKIENHISSSDFLLHISRKQYLDLSNITAVNVSAKLGFLYLNAPRAYYNANSISITQLNTSRAGCLYAKDVPAGVNVGNITCKSTFLEGNFQTSVSLVNSKFATRDLTITQSEIPISGCFSLYKTDTLSLSNSNCSSPILMGLLFSEEINPTQNTTKSLCIYSLGVTNLLLKNFTCELASAKYLLFGVEEVRLGFFKEISILKIGYSTFASNVGCQTLPLQEGKTLVTDSFFFNNTATTAGSVFSVDSNIFLELNRTTFISNTCEGCSGTINIQQGTLKITNSTFLNNTADIGGAINAEVATLTITDSNFQGNNAKTLGSVLKTHLCTVEMTHNVFEKNIVTSGEASIYLYDGLIFFQNNTFTNNIATLGAGNLAVLDAKELKIDNCTFTDDGEDSLSQVKGGFILIRNTKGTITGSTFNNARGNNGGAIYFDLKQKTNFLLKNSTFKGCRAENQGEAIYVKGIPDSLVEIQDVYVSCGTPLSYRTNAKDLSAVYCNQVTCQISDTIFDPWYADVDSGNQLYLYKGYNHSLKRVNFTADCETRGNCYRALSSAFRIEEVQSLTVEDSIFQGWGDRIVGNITEITSLGGAVRIEFPESKAHKFGGNYVFTNCSWKDNQAKSGGAIYATGVMNITVNGAAFANNFASNAGGGVYWASTSSISNFEVKGTGYFMNNRAENGGGFYFSGRKLSFESSSFLFSGNQAKYGNDKASYAIYVQLIENPAASLYTSYVDNIKASSKRLLESTYGDRNRYLSEYSSGEDLEPPMVLELFDEFGQHVATDSKSTIKAIATSVYGNNLKVDGNPFVAKNGYVVLYPLKIYVGPGSNVTFSFSLTSFSPAAVGRASENFMSLYTPSTQTISVRRCANGERVSDSFVCVACETGKYTILSNSTNQCQACPIGGICLGYDKFGPDANYFKLSYSTNTLVKCFNDEACKGALLEESETTTLYCKEQDKGKKTFCYTGWCSAGYQGNLCAECQEGYAYRNTDTRTCSKCSNSLSNYLISFGIGILGIIYIIVMIKSSLKEDKEDHEATNRNSNNSNKIRIQENFKNGKLTTSSKWKDKMSRTQNKKTSNLDKKKIENQDIEKVSLTSIYMKIFTNYAQMLAIVGTFRFDWPTEIIALFDVEEQISKSSVEIFSFDCFLRQPIFEKVGLNSFFSKLLIMSLSPLIISTIIILIWILIYSIKYKCDFQPKQKRQLKTNIIASIVVVLFILHPSIVELSTESFKCIQLGDSSADLYLEGNLDVKCWDSTHLKWALMIGLPSLIFWGLGIPIGALFVLYHNRKSLHLGSMKARYGFLYEGFYPNGYYWEFVIFYRKMILIIVSVFISSCGGIIQVITCFYELMFKGAIVLGITAFNYMLQERVKPYLTETLNELEKRSLIATGFTVYAGLYYLTCIQSSFYGCFFLAGLSRGGKIFLLVAIILINLYFFVFFVVELIKVQAKHLLKIKILKKRFGRYLEAIAKFDWKLRPKRSFSTNSQSGKTESMLDKEININLFESRIFSNIYSPSNSRLIRQESIKGNLENTSLKIQENTNRKYISTNRSQSEGLQLESFNYNTSGNWPFYAEKSVRTSKEFQREPSAPSTISKSVRMLQKLEYSIPYSSKEEASDSDRIKDAEDLFKRRTRKDSIFSQTDFPVVINVQPPEEEDQDNEIKDINLKQVTTTFVHQSNRIKPLGNFRLEVQKNIKDGDNYMSKLFEEVEVASSKELNDSNLIGMAEEVDKKESKLSFKELNRTNQEIDDEGQRIRSIILKKRYHNNKKGSKLVKISKIFEEKNEDIANEESIYKVDAEPSPQDIKRMKEKVKIKV